jgi:hypothetical protein
MNNVIRSATAPADRSALWIDTSTSNNEVKICNPNGTWLSVSTLPSSEGSASNSGSNSILDQSENGIIEGYIYNPDVAQYSQRDILISSTTDVLDFERTDIVYAQRIFTHIIQHKNNIFTGEDVNYYFDLIKRRGFSYRIIIEDEDYAELAGFHIAEFYTLRLNCGTCGGNVVLNYYITDGEETNITVQVNGVTYGQFMNNGEATITRKEVDVTTDCKKFLMFDVYLYTNGTGTKVLADNGKYIDLTAYIKDVIANS